MCDKEEISSFSNSILSPSTFSIMGSLFLSVFNFIKAFFKYLIISIFSEILLLFHSYTIFMSSKLSIFHINEILISLSNNIIILNLLNMFSIIFHISSMFSVLIHNSDDFESIIFLNVSLFL